MRTVESPWFRPLADDIVAGLVARAAGKVEFLPAERVRADYRFEGAAPGCSSEAQWHFDVHSEHLYELRRNDLEGHGRCEGIGTRFVSS